MKKSFGMLLVLKVKNAEIVSTVRGSSYNLNENQSEYDILTEEQRKDVYNRYYDNLK